MRANKPASAYCLQQVIESEPLFHMVQKYLTLGFLIVIAFSAKKGPARRS
jgi:hypothetical protein